MNADSKPKPDEGYRMNAAEFDEAMRKTFGVPPPAKGETKAIPMRVTKDRPKPTRRRLV